MSEAVVSIGNMVSDWYKKDGKFQHADIALAEYLNENPNCESGVMGQLLGRT